MLLISILHTFIDAFIDPGPIAPNSKTLSMVWRVLSYWVASENKTNSTYNLNSNENPNSTNLRTKLKSIDGVPTIKDEIKTSSI